MLRWKSLFFNLAFALNCLLVFLVVFEQRLSLPAWLHVAGRMHPLILHFPIVLVVLTIFWEVLPGYQKPDAQWRTSIGDVLLLATAVTAVITSLMGLFLSTEGGYTPDALQWHKWGGVFISLLTLFWYSFRHKVRQAKPLLITTTGVGLMMIVVTGHQGANITHGENFLLAPLMAEEEKPAVLLEDAVVYTHMVKPILEAKCTGCHNQKKAKGELVMETEAALLKGGKTGALWDTTEKDLGLMLQRIHLPLSHKKHMPPQGKPQLTGEEIEILYRWVKSGADFKTRVMDLPEGDTLRLLAAQQFSTIETDAYAFEPADEKEIQKLNTNYRLVRPLAAGSPALGVEFFSAAQFKPEQLKELLTVKEQIVSLNLNKMPVRDEDLKMITQFPNLRKLNLSFTNISGASLHELNQLKHLKQLSLSGTKVQGPQVRKLATLPALSRLYLWNTAVDSNEVKQLQVVLKGIAVETGFKGDTLLLQLTPPLVQNEEQVFTQPVPLKLKHYINGAVIRYTTDGKDPDSLTSPLYNNAVLIDRSMVVKAKAFKPGWISSKVVEQSFFKAGLKPDSIHLLTPPDPKFRAEGAETLLDNEKGDFNFRIGKWLGYNVQPLSAVMLFQKPQQLSSVTVSTLVDIYSYIMPPHYIEVWGGTDPERLRLLKRIRPQQPSEMQPPFFKAYDLAFEPVTVSTVKIVVAPLPVMPRWHQGVGEKGWAFVDEIFLYGE